ncbi:dihydropyrimidinase [Pseudonocardia dioxanivorans]|uniref:dihydropyrimidinase n=1 Tax=Pseudonocardia dioxanivorans TaxID=240495 RepID=UPI000CD07773|nr:dihydropyrimidinase [Pseudonocardia dioxanivorans]
MAHEFQLVVRGATVANADGHAVADVAVRDGVVVEVGSQVAGSGERELDGRGKVLAPGGIDPHTHFHTPSPDGSLMSADDYESGTRAAAAGGVTTVINYAFQQLGESLWTTLEREAAKADGRAHVDYGFHPILTDLLGGSSLAELAPLVEAGYPSVKIFTAYDPFRVTDREAIRVLAAAARAGALVNVHAEDDGLTHYLTDTLAAVPATVEPILSTFKRSRPEVAEELAIERIAVYARTVGCPVYFVHLSSRGAVEAVRRGRAAGGQIFTEVRPAYLFLDESRYDQPDGQRYVCVPPLRTADDQAALWDAIAAGEIETSASDHTTYSSAQKLGAYESFVDIPPGFASVQTGLGLLYGRGVAAGRMSLEQFVAITSANAAKLFGLWPRKGRIAPGADADLVLIDPDRTTTLADEPLQSASDYDPFVGIEVRGWPSVTVSRGDVVYRDGTITSTPGRGRWLHRRLGDPGTDPAIPSFSPRTGDPGPAVS